jgi:hypothetical protein
MSPGTNRRAGRLRILTPDQHSNENKDMEMQKVLIIALGLSSLGALAAVQPAAATTPKCMPVNCRFVSVPSRNPNPNAPVPGPNLICDQQCTTLSGQGSGGPQPIQLQKTRRAF